MSRHFTATIEHVPMMYLRFSVVLPSHRTTGVDRRRSTDSGFLLYETGCDRPSPPWRSILLFRAG